VYLRSTRSGAFAALAMAVALGGCADLDWNTANLFRKPVDVVGRSSGYTYSDLGETRRTGPVTDAVLVDANGSCPAAAPPPQPAAGAAAPGSDAPGLGEGVGLGMTECEVVSRAGPPNSVQLGRNPNGDRTAVLSYQGGPRPGIYHFERGRLTQMDRVEVAEPAPKPAKKKPAKSKKPPPGNNPA
jgi:hypothetical protein